MSPAFLLKGVLAAALAAVACDAAAQATPPMAPPRPVDRMTDAQQSWRFESEEQRRSNMPSEEELEARHGVERVALADRVAALVAEHKCNEARALANEHGDRQMALRVRQTCR